MKKLTQTQRVLRALRALGDHGVTSVDFLPPTVDGGPPILRVAARIHELREDGFVIQTRRGSTVDKYVLIGQAQPGSPLRDALKDAA